MQPVLKLVNDTDAAVRLDLVEQLPHVAMICQEAPDRLGDVLPRHLIQIIVRFLRDIDQQVRQSTHAALLALIDRGLLDKDSAEYVVAPTLLRMSQQLERLEVFTLAIDGMSKVARILDEATAERLFLNRYLALCKDNNFFIRKLCAIRFGEFSAAMGKEAVYDKLLPMYVAMCSDSVWSVRKSCADVIVSFACCVSLHHRRATLSEILANFLTDDSKWVKVSAFQILGPFISTFAKQFTGFSYNQYGELVLTDQHGTELRLSFAGTTEPPPCKSAITSGGQVLQFYEEDVNSSGVGKSNNVESMGGGSGGGGGGGGNSGNSGGGAADTNKENVPLMDHAKVKWYSRPFRYSSFESRDSSFPDESLEKSTDNDPTIAHDYDQFNPFRFYYIPPDLPLDSELVQAAMIESGSSTSSSSSSSVTPEAAREESQVVSVEQTSHPIEPDKSSSSSSADENSSDSSSSSSSSLSGNAKSNLDERLRMNVAVRQNTKGEIQKGEYEERMKELAQQLCEIIDLKKQEGSGGGGGHDESGDEANDSSLGGDSGSPKDPRINTSDMLNDTVDIDNISVDRSSLGGGGNLAGGASQSSSSSHEAAAAAGVAGGQTIVPHVLVDFFVSMADPSAVSIGIEIPRHCAFSFPAVALTLGRENWPLLKEAYAALADAREYRVRRTMASSIHELAMILGEDLAARDLLPIYDGFIKDLDEVRIGALKHLTTFLKVLRPADRRQFLPRLKAFLMMDNEWNWRFREEVASRLLEAIPLFTPADVSEHIAPLSFPLLTDKVAAVRHTALALVTQIISYLSTDEDLVTALITELKFMLASKTSKWTYRQAFALLCSSLISNDAISSERFGRDLLPSLFSLSADVVPNVRLAVVTALSQHVINICDYLAVEQAAKVNQTLIQMRTDPDRDVRIVAGGVAGKYYPQGAEWKVPELECGW